MALAAGISILAIASFSAWVLPRPIDPLLLTIPPMIEVLFEGLSKKYEGAWFLRTWYWICVILLSTALLIFFHAV
jgi:hypothetical protein